MTEKYSSFILKNTEFSPVYQIVVFAWIGYHVVSDVQCESDCWKSKEQCGKLSRKESVANTMLRGSVRAPKIFSKGKPKAAKPWGRSPQGFAAECLLKENYDGALALPKSTVAPRIPTFCNSGWMMCEPRCSVRNVNNEFILNSADIHNKNYTSKPGYAWPVWMI